MTCNLRLLFAVLCALLAFGAHAQWSPTRTIRLIVPYSTGTGTDTIARTIAAKLGETFGQQIVVDNQPGANGILGTEALARSAKDGHTLGMIAANHVVNQFLYSRLAYDPVKDFATVTIAGAVPFVLVVHPSLPAKSVKELIALATAKPGELLYGSAGSGSPPHLAGKLFKSMAGINIVHVPYKGLAPALIDLVGGQTSLAFPAISAGMPHAKTGRLRALAVTSLKRTSAASDLPTLHESGLKGYEVYSWIGMMGPAGLPKDVVARLHAEVTRIIRIPDVREKLLAQGIDLIGNTPEDFARIMQNDAAKWGKIVRESGARLD